MLVTIVRVRKFLSSWGSKVCQGQVLAQNCGRMSAWYECPESTCPVKNCVKEHKVCEEMEQIALQFHLRVRQSWNFYATLSSSNTDTSC